MDTNKPKDCDFCRRDEGLSVVVARKSLYHDDMESFFRNDYSDHENFFDDLNTLKKFNSLDDYKQHLLSMYRVVQDNEIKRVRIFESGFYKKSLGINSPQNFYYQLSTLRTGYLYVYQEHINRWEEYAIVEGGFLSRIDNNNFDNNNAVNQQTDRQPCYVAGHREKAMTITIPNPKKAKTVWFQFSDVAWSTNTKKLNKQHYKEFMHAFDVKAYLDNGVAENTFLLSKDNLYNFHDNFLDKIDLPPADYSNGPVPIQNAEGISPYNSSQQSQKYFLDTQKQLRNLATQLVQKYDEAGLTTYFNSTSAKDIRITAGAIFCIDDPISLVMDIGSAITGFQTYTKHFSDEEKTLNDIDALKAAITNMNENPFLTDEEFAEWQKINNMGMSSGAYWGRSIVEWLKSDEEKLEEELKLKENLNRNKILDWERNYQNCLDQVKYNAALNSRAQKLQEKVAVINILDQWLANIWNTSPYKNYWKYNFEKNEMYQGLQYVWLMVRVLSTMPNTPKILEHLADLTTKNRQQADNCLMNALCLNHDSIKSSIGLALNADSISTMPWGDLTTRFTSATSVFTPQLKAALYSGYSTLILKLNPVVEYCIQTHPNSVIRGEVTKFPIHPAAIGMLAIQGKRFASQEIKFSTHTEFNGQVKNLLKRFHVAVYGSSKGFNDNQMLHLIAKDPFWQAVRTNNPNGFVVPDFEYASSTTPSNTRTSMQQATQAMQNASASLNLTREQIIATVQNPAATPQLLTNITLAQQRMVITGNILLQSWALKTIITDPKIKGLEKKSKIGAGVTGVFMATTEAVAFLTNSYIASGAKASSGLLKFNYYLGILTDTSKPYSFWRVLGASVGIVFGANDMVTGVNAYQQGEQKYGQLVFASGLSIVGSSIILWIGGVTNPIGWILIFVGISFSVIANLIRDNDAQKWLYRSQLGTPKKYIPYDNYDTQLVDFKLLYNPS